jgi:OmcA/MtrC family decaheme c-type cytochrome
MTSAATIVRFPMAALAVLVLAGCGGSDGSNGKNGQPGAPGDPAPTPTSLSNFDDPPGVNFGINGLSGGGGGSLTADAADVPHFSVGDKITVNFSLTKGDGSPWGLSEMSTVRVLVSGPSFNYQRVMAEQNDVVANAVKQPDGSWSYTFPTAIPSTYLAPLNDSDSFGASDGELTGQPLLAGTYTLGLYGYWTYTVNGQEYKDVGNVETDFLLGNSSTLAPHEVVTRDNCNQCHVNLQAHGGMRRDTRLCQLCHTAGAEDKNDATAGGTPGVSIDFKVMIHKLHNGAHLPSVNGVATNDDGTRNYAATPQPYQLVGFGDAIHDFSEVHYPVWPNLTSNMPKDFGYSALTSGQKTQEDNIRGGATTCLKCHGDPDATGPLPAPAQGDLYKLQPSQNACGSCHDDIRWDKPYTSNQQTMPEQVSGNQACNACHASDGTALAVSDAHLHPLDNPVLNPGVNVNVTSLSGGTGAGGKFQAGDAPIFHYTLKDDDGNDVPITGMDSSSAVFNGPTWSQQIITPYNSSNGVSISPYDFAGRLQSSSSTGKGTMSKVVPTGTPVAETLVVQFSSATAFSVNGTASGDLGAGALPASPSTNPSSSSLGGLILTSAAVPQTVTVAFTDNTHFSVTGSVSGVMGNGTLPAGTNGSVKFVSGDGTLTFDLTVGATAFVGGNSIYLVIYKGGAANPVLFAIVAGRTSFGFAAPAPDRFYYEVVPAAASYDLTLPMDLSAEYLGDGNGIAGQAFTAANLPVYYGRQSLSEVTATANPTTLSADAAPYDRYVDVASTTGYSTSAPNNFLVLDAAGAVGTREYLQVALVESGTRMWVRTPVRYAHAAGAAVQRATLTFRQEGAANQYTLDQATGTITTVAAFGNGNALVLSYRTAGRFGWKRHLGDALQSVYQPPPNDSNALGKDWGEWTGLPYVDGTYTASLWLYTNIDVGLYGEEQVYRAAAIAANANLLYGTTATTIEPHAILESPNTCDRCHNETQFHGSGRAGFQACVQCHGIGGAEDLPQYNTSTAAATTGTTIDFRTMLHKIHMGEDLANASSYAVVGFGGASSNYADVIFPPMPGGVRNCFICHGADSDSWKEPQDRDYPTGQSPTVHEWASSCGACHVEDDAVAHIGAMTAPDGAESCGVCHGQDAEFSVEVMHKPR